MTTARDIAALPAKQRDVLSEVCIGNDRGHHPATLADEGRKGFLQEIVIEEPTRYGLFRYSRYDVATVGVHMAWCEWCSAQSDLED